MNQDRYASLLDQLKPALQALGIDDTSWDTCARRTLYERVMTTDAGKSRKILGTSVKIEKGEKVGVLTAVLYLSASTRSGVNLCPWASAGCAAACLGHTTGRLLMNQAQRAQLYKTVAWLVGREWFLSQLDDEIRKHARRAERLGMRCAVRLNGSSDILWERHGVPQRHPDVEFYDYTKAPLSARRNRPSNYHLTFSLDEREVSEARAMEWLTQGGNVAMVVAAAGSASKSLAQDVAQGLVRSGHHGFNAVDGDETDIRMDDPPSSWVVLYAKGGQALRDATGFVRRFASEVL